MPQAPVVEITLMPDRTRAPRDGGARSSIYDDITPDHRRTRGGRLPGSSPGTASASPARPPRNRGHPAPILRVQHPDPLGRVSSRHSDAGWLPSAKRWRSAAMSARASARHPPVYADRFPPEERKAPAVRPAIRPGSDPLSQALHRLQRAQCEGLPEEIAVVAPPPPAGMI